MGCAVSTGQNNDELVDNLVKTGYIRTKKVEQVFRAVDRADYFLTSHRENAYKDIAWKHGNIHLSAPCVYSLAIEGLSLEPGLSFMNLGSGTGYLSTMAGLILSQNGTNHGIELHEDCMNYAYERLEEFKQKSLALDEFDFCEPSFVQGNCLTIVPGRQYDRVYCGAACPESHEALVKQFVRVGGILVVPLKDHLLRLQRVDENTWVHKTMLPVSFTPLIKPPSEELNMFHLPECDPLSLQELCRDKIRHRLRENVWQEHAELETRKPILPRQQNLRQRTLKSVVIPIFGESDEPMLQAYEEFGGETRLVLNMDAHPGEAITTTLQLVRSVMQSPQNETESTNSDDGNRQYIVASVDFHLDNIDERRESDSEALLTEAGRTNTSTESNVDSISDQSESQVQSQSSNVEKEDSPLWKMYTNMSESDSDSDSDSNSEPDQETSFTQRKKVTKREEMDSGIVEDANLPSYEGSSSSTTSPSSSSRICNFEGGLPDGVRKSLRSMFNSYRGSTDDNIPDKNVIYGHYVDRNAFSTYMKEKIHQLPLPFSLKLYINYNRHL